MKFSAVAALCVAPLTLAGTLDMDLRSRNSLVQREDLLVATREKDSSQKDSSSKKSSSNNNNQISSITQTSSTEVIIIWVNPGNGAETTTNSAAPPAATAAAAAAAATHTVVVGGATKVFTPDTINAAVGDMVVFQFQEQNHTVTQSNFAAPCVSNGGMDSGFMPNPNGTISPPPQVAMAVNVSTPIWFYCRQTGHCGAGMTFSINPTANKTQADFKALAIQQNGTGTAAPIAAPPAGATTVSVASVATSVAATSAAAATGATASSSSSSTGLTTGTGTTNSDGSCTCAVVCAAGSIPNVAAQGVNAFGGMGGSVPASAMEITA